MWASRSISCWLTNNLTNNNSLNLFVVTLLTHFHCSHAHRRLLGVCVGVQEGARGVFSCLTNKLTKNLCVS